jgi:8-oxo-dGTP diphosphatase
MKIKERRPKVGVGVVVCKEGKVLLGKRKNTHGAGEWSFPGGHLEFAETVEQCAHRELIEETGLRATSFQLGPWSNNLIDQDKHYITLFAFTTQFEGDPQLLEPEKCEGWQWFDWEHLPSPVFLPIRSLVEKLGVEKLKRMDISYQTI